MGDLIVVCERCKCESKVAIAQLTGPAVLRLDGCDCSARIAALESDLAQARAERDAMQAERDSLLTTVDFQQHSVISGLSAQVEALTKFAEHRERCAVYPQETVGVFGSHWTEPGPCTCGLSAALKPSAAKEGA